MALVIEPTDASLGVDIWGLDLSKPVAEPDAMLLRHAWGKHLVLRLREQPINDYQHMTFSRIFGDIELTPAGVLARDYGVRNGAHMKSSIPPEVTVVSNIIENGAPIGALGDSELEWHTDASFLDIPPIGSALRALEVPSAGGETGFIDMYAAYENLTPRLKKKISDIQLLHSRLRSSDGKLRRGFEHIVVDDVSKAPGAVHPVVRVHPDTGRKLLFLGRRLGAYVIGMNFRDSESLLDEIWESAVEDRFTWYQDWRVGDLVIWDNRCTMHRRNAFDPGARRRMHRTQIIAKRGGEFMPWTAGRKIS